MHARHAPNDLLRVGRNLRPGLRPDLRFELCGAVVRIFLKGARRFAQLFPLEWDVAQLMDGRRTIGDLVTITQHFNPEVTREHVATLVINLDGLGLLTSKLGTDPKNAVLAWQSGTAGPIERAPLIPGDDFGSVTEVAKASEYEDRQTEQRFAQLMPVAPPDLDTAELATVSEQLAQSLAPQTTTRGSAVAPVRPERSAFVNTVQVVAAGQQALSREARLYVTGGAESETTVRLNREAFGTIRFRPRVLRDVSVVDARAKVVGCHLRIPVMIAPVANLEIVSPDAAVSAARVASDFGVMFHCSMLTEPSLETIAAACPGPKSFQLYIRGDRAWARQMIDRALAAGFQSITLTVDSPKLKLPDRLKETSWRPPGVNRYPAELRIWQARLTWEWVAEMRAHAKVPFFIKGIQTAEDALLAVEHGVDAIYISNHGGRQLDYVDSSIDLLAEIATAVRGRAPIMFDGGIMRGSDVVKAMALGANAVAIGRLAVYALAAGGAPALRRTLEILEEEIKDAMALLGVTKWSELTSTYIRRTTTSHEM